MDADVAALVARERVVEAAELAASRGDAATASELFERACDFPRAAAEALRAGEAERALPLAVVGRDDALAQRALDALQARGPGDLERAAARLELRGDFGWAARAHEARGAAREAASAYERAGEATRSAALYEQSGDPVAASKVLEATIRRDPSQLACHVALGKLLARYGKHEAAVRALQHVPRDAPERREALDALAGSLGAMGLAEAADEASRELASLTASASPAGTAERARPSPTPAPAKEVLRRLFGRYEVVREVASTATSRVLECTDSVRGERVAVKMFAAYDARGAGRDALARFEREVRVLGALDHPNIVPLRDFIPDGPALVLAWMSGGTLEVKMQSALAPARAIEIADAVLRALGEAHRLGVLHRDVKPANVLFDDAGVARLSDFGVAHLGDLSTTATAAVIGTLAYMSPEQREGKPATVQSDIYGVGAILFEMLTGEKLVLGEAPKTRPSGAHRDLDPRHDEAVMRLLAESPADRPPDAFAARRELSSLTWPKDVERAPIKPRPARAPSEQPGPTRLTVQLDGKLVDSWTGRAIERVPLTPQSLSRAGGFARAALRTLQTVLRVDREDDAIWLETAAGKPLDRPLSAAEHQALLQALDALHAQGVVHGHVDRAHVVVGAPDPLLRFEAEADKAATADTDFAQLRRLLEPPRA